MILEERENEIRRRMKKRYDKRAEYLTHLASFFIIIPAIWLFVLPNVGGSSSVFGILGILFTIGWFVGIVSHSINFILYELGERATQHEIEKEREFYYLAIAEKPKNEARSRLMSLTNDGEIIDYDEEEDYRYR